MLRVPLCALSLSLLSNWAAAQDPTALVRLIESRYSAADEGDIHAFLTDAARAGLVRNRAEHIVAKDVFRSYLAKNADSIAVAQAALLRSGGGSAGPANGADVECNDVAGFADTLTVSAGSTCIVNGAVGTGDARDVYRLVLTGGTPDHSMVISTVPAGASTSPPSTLNLADSGQRFILNGTLVGTTRSIAGIGLPNGVYYVTVAGTGTYTLNITSTGTTIPTLVNGATGSFTMAPEVHTFRLVVGAPAELVRIEVTNQTAADTGDYFFNLGRAKGGRVLFMDDTLVPPATSAQADPLIDAELPTGTYYVFLQEFFNATTAANYRINYTATPLGSVPPLVGANTYTIVHGGSFFLYALPLTTTERFSLAVTRASTGGDQIVEIMDAEMGQVLFFDDSATGLAGGTLYPYGDNTLPAGRYWALARNFSTTASTNFGAAWTVTTTSGLPVTLNTLGNRRTEPLSIALGGHYAFTHRACTDTPLTAAHTPANLSLVGADGLLRGYFRNLATAGTSSLIGTSLRMDEAVYGNLMNTNYAASTTATVYLSGNLGVDLTPVSTTGAYQLKGEDKIGNTHYLFLSVGQGPGFIPGPPFSGRLCLDFLTLTPLFFHTFASDCRVNYTTTYFGGLDLRPFIEPVTTPGLRFQAVVLPSLQFTDIAQ